MYDDLSQGSRSKEGKGYTPRIWKQKLGKEGKPRVKAEKESKGSKQGIEDQRSKEDSSMKTFSFHSPNQREAQRFSNQDQTRPSSKPS